MISRKLDNHGPEIIGGILLLATSALLRFIGVSPDVAWFAGIMSVLLPLSVAATKHYFTSVLHEFVRNRQETEGRSARIATILGEVDGLQFLSAQKVVDATLTELEKIKRGVIPLDAADYFHEIMYRMHRAPPGTQVHAVNVIDELRWRLDPSEVNFLKANFAALSREVTISRIFVLSRTKFYTGNPRQRIEVLKQQAGHERLTLWIVWKETLVGQEHRCRDWVAFDKPSLVVFTDYANPIDPTRVSHGEMIMNQRDIEPFLSDFSILLEAATLVDKDFFDTLESMPPPDAPAALNDVN
ncbi:MAG: hypothetical protein AABO41_09910 [Acidobacteriota bacterium]